MISDQQLVDWKEEGFLIGPKESEERALYRYAKYQTLERLSFNHPRFGSFASYAKIKKKKSLLPWFGAMTSYLEEDGVLLPDITIGSSASSEIVDHELLHATRSAFNFSVFEEFLAYESSKGFRRRFGPLIQQPWQANSLVFLSICSSVYPLLSLPLLLLFAFLLFKLEKRKSIYEKALKTISSLFSIEPLKVAVHLIDEEFVLFSKGEEKKIKEYFQTHRDELRWKQIFALFSLKQGKKEESQEKQSLIN